jgi:hypothetical protein
MVIGSRCLGEEELEPEGDSADADLGLVLTVGRDTSPSDGSGLVSDFTPRGGKSLRLLFLPDCSVSLVTWSTPATGTETTEAIGW